MPATNRSSPALTRVICEYWPSGLPRLCGLLMRISAKLFCGDGLLRELAPHLVGELGAPHRLHVISVGPVGEAFADGDRIGHDGNHDHGGRAVCFAGPHVLE